MHAGGEGSDKLHTPRSTEFAFGENRGRPRAFAHAVYAPARTSSWAQALTWCAASSATAGG